MLLVKQNSRNISMKLVIMKINTENKLKILELIHNKMKKRKNQQNQVLQVEVHLQTAHLLILIPQIVIKNRRKRNRYNLRKRVQIVSHKDQNLLEVALEVEVMMILILTRMILILILLKSRRIIFKLFQEGKQCLKKFNFCSYQENK